jgi:epsilon-lactone hydrolase
VQSIRSRLIYEFYQSFGSPFAATKPLELQRAAFEKQGRRAKMPEGVDMSSASIGSMHAEWLRPEDSQVEAAILYLHGGSYTMGSCRTHRALAARIAAAARAPALIINYRLAPENPFPAALTDTKNAYGWLLHQGIDPRRIVVVGDSAGGGLALALAVGLRDQGLALPRAIVCISPWGDLTLSGETMTTCAEADPLLSWNTSVLHARRYVGEHDPREPFISPLFADLGGLPPLLIQVGQHEVLRSDSQRLAARAREAGVEVKLEVWPGMWHVWHAWAGSVPEAGRAIRRIGEFVCARVGA